MHGGMHWHACKTTCVRKRIRQVCISWANAIQGGHLLSLEKGRQGGLPQAHRRAKLMHDKQANFGLAQQAKKSLPQGPPDGWKRVGQSTEGVTIKTDFTVRVNFPRTLRRRATLPRKASSPWTANLPRCHKGHLCQGKQLCGRW